MTEEHKQEEWVEKCLSCVHCYREQKDYDYLYCRCK